MKTAPNGEKEAVTRTEILVLIAVCAALLALALRGRIANKTAKAAAATAVCAKNLKELGYAYLVWVHDSGIGEFPFFAAVQDGGNMAPLGTGGESPSVNPSLERNHVYWQFAFISNQLPTPKILVCPADRGVGSQRVVAKTFGMDPSAAGLMARGFRDRACSYTLGLDASALPGAVDHESIGGILSTDRNLEWDGQSTKCVSGVGEARQFNLGRWLEGPARTRVGWTNAIHGNRGQVLCADGSVENLSTEQLRELRTDWYKEPSDIHYLAPE